jgi:hypothetical protein
MFNKGSRHNSGQVAHISSVLTLFDAGRMAQSARAATGKTMHVMKETYSSAILILEVVGIALFGAIAYRNDSSDEWEDYMNLAPPPPARPPVHRHSSTR